MFYFAFTRSVVPPKPKRNQPSMKLNWSNNLPECVSLRVPRSKISNSCAKTLFTLLRFRNRLLVAPNHSIFHLLVGHRKNRTKPSAIFLYRYIVSGWLQLISLCNKKRKIAFIGLFGLVQSIFGIVTRRARLILDVLLEIVRGFCYMSLESTKKNFFLLVCGPVNQRNAWVAP